MNPRRRMEASVEATSLGMSEMLVSARVSCELERIKSSEGG